MEPVYTVKELAELEYTSPWVISQRCREGKYPGAYKSGEGPRRSPWRIPESAVEAYRKAHVPGNEPADPFILEPRSGLAQARR